MPIFEYQCRECEITEEHLVKKYDDPINCPKCSLQMIKLIGAPAFKLKGEGFYGAGSNPRVSEGPKIPSEISNLSDVDLNRSLGLPDDHKQPLTWLVLCDIREG